MQTRGVCRKCRGLLRMSGLCTTRVSHIRRIAIPLTSSFITISGFGSFTFTMCDITTLHNFFFLFLFLAEMSAQMKRRTNNHITLHAIINIIRTVAV